MRTKKAVCLALMVLLLAACGATEPELCRDTAAEYLTQSEAIYERWIDAVVLADSTPRIALGAVVADMQQIQREYGELVAPECAEMTHTWLAGSMDYTISAFLMFMQEDDDEVIGNALQKGAYYLERYVSLIDKIMAGTDTVPATP